MCYFCINSLNITFCGKSMKGGYFFLGCNDNQIEIRKSEVFQKKRNLVKCYAIFRKRFNSIAIKILS